MTGKSCSECKHVRHESLGVLSAPAVYCDHPDRGWGFRILGLRSDDVACGPDGKLFESVFDETPLTNDGSKFGNTKFAS